MATSSVTDRLRTDRVRESRGPKGGTRTRDHDMTSYVQCATGGECWVGDHVRLLSI